MNQKTSNILFVALPSPNTKKNHPKWDLGKDFFPSLYRKIKDQNPSISKDFTNTFLKFPRDGLETTWRQCWSSGLKNVLRKLLSIGQAIGKPLSLIMQFQLISKSYSLDYEFESTAFSVVLDDNPEVCLPWFYPKYVPRYSHNNFSLQ